eukprot:6636260-Alexandrium_andersonii.AAC.1
MRRHAAGVRPGRWEVQGRAQGPTRACSMCAARGVLKGGRLRGPERTWRRSWAEGWAAGWEQGP